MQDSESIISDLAELEALVASEKRAADRRRRRKPVTDETIPAEHRSAPAQGIENTVADSSATAKGATGMRVWPKSILGW